MGNSFLHQDKEKRMSSTETFVGGLSLKNPVILASAGYASTAKGIEQHIARGYGAIVTKTVTIKPLGGAPKPTVFWYDPEEKMLLSGAEALKNPGIDKMAEFLKEVMPLAKAANCKIIGSCTGNSIEEILSVAKKYEEAGASAIELNMVCPSSGPHLGPDYAQVGKWWAAEAERATALITKLQKSLQIPVWAKLPLERLIDKKFFDQLLSSPPDAISFVGGRLPNLKINVETGEPLLPGNLKVMIEQSIPISPMVTGPVKPSTILHTAYLAKQTTVPLVCSGGLEKGEDVLEALMAGASAVQICKAVYRNIDAGQKIISQFSEALIKYNYSSVKEIKGKALPFLPNPPLLTVPMARWL
jgi:dihydroorotate dehydrogenase